MIRRIPSSLLAAQEGAQVLPICAKLEQDIATWENNIGFFEKSKGAEALLGDFRTKIDEAKKELAALEAKIKEMASDE